MFGQKLNSFMGNAFNKTKDFLGAAYTKTKHALGTADVIFSKFKNIYNKVQPALQDAAPEQLKQTMSNIDSRIQQGMGGYSGIREKNGQAENKMLNTVGNVMSALK